MGKINWDQCKIGSFVIFSKFILIKNRRSGHAMLMLLKIIIAHDNFKVNSKAAFKRGNVVQCFSVYLKI